MRLASLLLLLWGLSPATGEGSPPSAADGLPTLLYFHAEWCSWCRRFERETLAHPRVVGRIAGRYRLLRLDADRKGALFRRYGGRGLPFVVLLDPGGRALRTFTGMADADTLLAWLERERRTAGPAPGLPVDPGRFHPLLQALYDPISRRFDGHTLEGITGTKHPQPLTMLHLLHACAPAAEAPLPCPDAVWRSRLPAMLDALRARLEDTLEGGFFYYAARDEGGYVETAKRLGRNARILWLEAEACRLLEGDPDCAATRRTLTWLERSLWNGLAWRAGQHSDEGYFSLPLEQRRQRPPPPIDPIEPPGANAQAVIALLHAARALGDTAPRQRALQVAGRLGALLDRLSHSRPVETAPSDPALPFPEPSLEEEAWIVLALWHAGREAGGGRLLDRLDGWLTHLEKEHYDTGRAAFVDPVADGSEPLPHPLANGLLAHLCLQMVEQGRRCPFLTDLPRLFRLARWEPAIQPDDLVFLVEAWQVWGRTPPRENRSPRGE